MFLIFDFVGNSRKVIFEKLFIFFLEIDKKYFIYIFF